MHELRRFTQAVDSMPTEREMEEYINLLEIRKSDLKKWKTILDLGAGTTQEFSRGYAQSGHGGKVVSLDPNLGIPWSQEKARYFQEEYSHRLMGRNHAQENTVAGLSQGLPFKNASFDAVLALYSMPKWVTEKDDVIESVSEIARVLRSNGEAKIFPIHESVNKAIIEEALEGIENISFEFTLKERVASDNKWLLKMLKLHSNR